MSPSQLFRRLERDHVINAAAALRANSVTHRFHESERYDVIVEGTRYPPKAITGIACSYLVSRVLAPDEFSGGAGSPCFRALERLRFEIVKKETYDENESFRFRPGVRYRRAEIHDRFGGQERGGISTPTSSPFVFLFTGERGDEFGYRDEFKDGVFHYTGEGQVGDMAMLRGNSAIRDSATDGKRLLLFETPNKGVARFVGEMRYLGHHSEVRPDRNGALRNAIVFELELVAPEQTRAEETSPGDYSAPLGRTLSELRTAALTAASASAPVAVRKQEIRRRSEAIKRYVLKRADGVCEGCSNPAPFRTPTGQPYLEPHHTTRVADGGPDHPAHVIALCPTCHRRAHHASDSETFNHSLKARLAEIEATD